MTNKTKTPIDILASGKPFAISVDDYHEFGQDIFNQLGLSCEEIGYCGRIVDNYVGVVFKSDTEVTVKQIKEALKDHLDCADWGDEYFGCSVLENYLEVKE